MFLLKAKNIDTHNTSPTLHPVQDNSILTN